MPATDEGTAHVASVFDVAHTPGFSVTVAATGPPTDVTPEGIEERRKQRIDAAERRRGKKKKTEGAWDASMHQHLLGSSSCQAKPSCSSDPPAAAGKSDETPPCSSKRRSLQRTLMDGGQLGPLPKRQRRVRPVVASAADITTFFQASVSSVSLGCSFWTTSGGNIDFCRVGKLADGTLKMPDFGNVVDRDGNMVNTVPTPERALLLEAPCGFGKTTKLCKWLRAELREHPDRPVIFIICRKVHAINTMKDCCRELRDFGFVMYCDENGGAKGAKKRLEGRTRVIVSLTSFGALVASGSLDRFKGGYLGYDEVRSIAGCIARAPDLITKPLVKEPQPILDALKRLSETCTEVFADADVSVCPRVLNFLQAVMAPGKRINHVQFTQPPLRRSLAFTWACKDVKGGDIWNAHLAVKIEGVRQDSEQRILIGCAGAGQVREVRDYCIEQGVPLEKIAHYTGGAGADLKAFEDANEAWRTKWVVVLNTCVTVAVDLQINFAGLFCRTSKRNAGLMSDLFQLMVRARVASDETIYILIDGKPLCMDATEAINSSALLRDDVKCDCNRPAREYVSETEMNPGKHFLCCQNWKEEDDCKFFQWTGAPPARREGAGAAHGPCNADTGGTEVDTPVEDTLQLLTTNFRRRIHSMYSMALTEVRDTLGRAGDVLEDERRVGGSAVAPQAMSETTVALYASSTTDLERPLNTRYHALWCFYLARHATRDWEIRELHLPELQSVAETVDAEAEQAAPPQVHEQDTEEERVQAMTDYTSRYAWVCEKHVEVQASERQGEPPDHEGEEVDHARKLSEWKFFNSQDSALRLQLIQPDLAVGEPQRWRQAAVDEVFCTLRPIGRFLRRTVGNDTDESIHDLYKKLYKNRVAIDCRVRMLTLGTEELLRSDNAMRSGGQGPRCGELANPVAQRSASTLMQGLNELASMLVLQDGFREFVMHPDASPIVWTQGASRAIDLNNALLGSEKGSPDDAATQKAILSLLRGPSFGLKLPSKSGVIAALKQCLEETIAMTLIVKKTNRLLPSGCQTRLWVTSVWLERIAGVLDDEWTVWHEQLHRNVPSSEFRANDSPHLASMLSGEQQSTVVDPNKHTVSYSAHALQRMIAAARADGAASMKLEEELLALQKRFPPPTEAGLCLLTEHYSSKHCRAGMGLPVLEGDLFTCAESALGALLRGKTGGGGQRAVTASTRRPFHPGVRASLVADRYHKLHVPNAVVVLAHAEAVRCGFTYGTLRQAAEYLTQRETDDWSATQQLKKAGDAELCRAVWLDGADRRDQPGILSELRAEASHLRDALFETDAWRVAADKELGMAMESAVQAGAKGNELSEQAPARRTKVWRLLLSELQRRVVQTVGDTAQQCGFRVTGMWQRSPGPQATACVYVEGPPDDDEGPELDDLTGLAQRNLRAHFGDWWPDSALCEDWAFHGKQDVWDGVLASAVAAQK